MKRGPTTFSLILCLLAVALFLALALAAALWLRSGVRMVGNTYGRLIVSTVLAADELSTRNDTSAAVTLARMQRLGLRFSDESPPAQSITRVGTPMVGELGRSIGELVGDPARVVVVRASEAEIWIRSAHDPKRWIVLEGSNFRRQLIGPSTTILLVAGLIALLMSEIAARILTRPLERLSRNAHAWLRGESMHDSLSGSPREVRHLAAAIGDAGARLRETARERELMLAGISHDLRTPLARLRLALELGDAGESERRAAMVADIEQLDAALEQCLAFVRDGRDEALRPTDLATVAGQLLTLRSKPEAWHLDAPPTLYTCVRPTLLRRAIGNLMDNAERYGAAPFQVELGCDGEQVRIRVTDSGQGVAATLLAKLGQPFLRGDAARSSAGNGLGLSIVARAAQLHDGTLQLRNAATGGFEAQISIPYRPA